MSHLEDTLKLLVERRGLTFQQAADVIGEVMSGEFSPTRLAAWLVALRMKGETAEEIAGCASAMTAHCRPVRLSRPDAIDIVGTGGDCSGTVNVSTGAAIVAAACGQAVAKHGNRSISSQCGSADVLSALGVDPSLAPDAASACLEEVGITFLFAPVMHPAMRHAAPIRRELGVRTVFNILGPLCNPARVRRAVVGVYEPRLLRLMAEASAQLGMERLLVVHGQDGTDEATTAAKTSVVDSVGGRISEYEIDPGAHGIPLASKESLRGGSPTLNSELLRRVLSGEKMPARDVILLNAALGLLVGGRATTLNDGLALSAAAVDSGAALRKLAHWIEFTRKFADAKA